jgi:hypothetical protein
MSHYAKLGVKCPKCKTTIECKEVVQNLNFNRGNVVKYIWRADFKGAELEDLIKARDYINWEIERVQKENTVSYVVYEPICLYGEDES